MGCRAETLDLGEGRANVVGVFENGPGPSFAFNTHIDVVPAGDGWNGDPFTLREAGEKTVSSCESGTCGTCKCRLVSGEVEMVANHALEDYEVEQGYVLSCQSYPVTDRLVVDYDQ